jgi:hypothetical protein
MRPEGRIFIYAVYLVDAKGLPRNYLQHMGLVHSEREEDGKESPERTSFLSKVPIKEFIMDVPLYAARTGTARTVTFCLSGTGTGTQFGYCSGSRTGFLFLGNC